MGLLPAVRGVERAAERPGGTFTGGGRAFQKEGDPKQSTPVQTTTPRLETRGRKVWTGIGQGAADHMNCDTTTRTAATHPVPDTTTTTERPSSVAIRRVLARGVPDCTIATLYAFARNANVAMARDVHRFPGKLRRGEVFTFVRWSTVADRTGQGYSTVKRHVRPWKDTGAVEVRQVARTLRLTVFVASEPAGEPAGEPADMNHVREPREEPQTPNTPCRKRVAHPDRPATARQTRTMQHMAQERGLADPTSILANSFTGARTPVALTRGQADDWIQYVKAGRGGLVKLVYRTEEPPTEAQCMLLRVLGVADAPATRGEADEAIRR